jgi:hydroxyacyl-ACP dehydratase HTD2-like protein with hotdog domain
MKPTTTKISRCALRLSNSSGTAATSRRRLSTTVSSAAEAADHLLTTFANKSTTRRQVLDGNQLQRLSLTLNRPHLHPSLSVAEDAPPQGTPLPPGYHLVYFTPAGVETELGLDGTDKTFNAPSPFTRRMWAGGKMSWVKDGAKLKVGDEVEEHTKLLGAVAKKSRDGSEMVLVDVEKSFLVGGQDLAMVDQR